MQKATQLRDLSTDELEATCEDLRKELFQIVNDSKQAKKLDRPHLLKKNKKTIARIKTILTERKSNKQTED